MKTTTINKMEERDMIHKRIDAIRKSMWIDITALQSVQYKSVDEECRDIAEIGKQADAILALRKACEHLQ